MTSIQQSVVEGKGSIWVYKGELQVEEKRMVKYDNDLGVILLIQVFISAKIGHK